MNDLETIRMQWKELKGRKVIARNDCIVHYLVHYCAPYTGSNATCILEGTVFLLRSEMRGDAYYCDVIEPKDLEKQTSKSQAECDKGTPLEDRLTSISFYLTQQDVYKYFHIMEANE